MKLDLTLTFLELGDATSRNLGFSHCDDFWVSYGEETITETNLSTGAGLFSKAAAYPVTPAAAGRYRSWDRAVGNCGRGLEGSGLEPEFASTAITRQRLIVLTYSKTTIN